MFGAQPPEYIVAPAAIHPGAAMPPPTIQQILSRQPQANTTMSQQSAQPVMSSQQQMMVSQQSAHALPPAKVCHPPAKVVLPPATCSDTYMLHPEFG